MARPSLPVPAELSAALSSDGRPVYLGIAHWLAAEIRRGRLRPEAPLPSSRALARDLGLNRNTVVAAYQELVAEGYLVTRGTGGTFVSADLPELPERARPAVVATSAEPGFPLSLPQGPAPTALPPGIRYALHGGVPDLRPLPAAALARAYRRALLRRSQQVLSYGASDSSLELREQLAALVRQNRGLVADPERILVTRGSQMGLYLLGRLLLRPGDRIALEELSYGPAAAAFRSAGAQIVRVRHDDQGVIVEDVARAAREKRLRAVYLTPHHQYPTTATLSIARRLALLELARRERIALIEDDYDHEFHYDGRPVLPLASADTSGVVIYVGTLAKVLAPGLRLGFVVAPPRVVAGLAALRGTIDRQGDHALEAAVAELIEDGEFQRHTQRMRRLYEARRNAFVELLERAFGAELEFRVPAGGMALWVRAEGRSAVTWQRRALREGVHFLAGPEFATGGAQQGQRFAAYARLGFARYDERELADAVRRLEKAFPARGRRG